MNHSIDNFIGVFEDILPDGFCDRAIEYFNNISDAGMSSNRLEEGVSRTYKDDATVFMSDENVVNLSYTKNLSAEFLNVFWTTAYRAYADKYSVLDDVASRHNTYGIRAQRTNVGEGYHVWHFETGNRSNSNRILAFILYLNDVEEGGETEFLYLSRRVKPKKGTLIIFPASFTHTHRGNPPISNVKYVLTGWTEY